MERRIVTINVQNSVFDAIERLVRAGLFNNKSEFIRTAVRLFIDREIRGLKVMARVRIVTDSVPFSGKDPLVEQLQALALSGGAEA